MNNLPKDFLSLPQEIYLKIIAYLPIHFALRLGLVCKKMNHLLKQEIYWESKFKIHFPHRYNPHKETPKSNYRELFKEAYLTEYANLDKRGRDLFSLIKDCDINQFQLNHLKLNDFYLKDKPGKNLFSWGKEKCLLNDFYKIIEKEYTLGGKLNSKKRDPYQRTILHWSVLCQQSLKIIEALVQQGADKNAGDRYKKKPLVYALEIGHLEAINLFIDEKNVNKSLLFDEFLHKASMQHRQTKISRSAANKGTRKCDATNANEMMKLTSPQFQNLRRHQEKKERGLFEIEITPLMLAAQKGRLEAITLLLSIEKVDINIVLKNKKTALMYAAENGHLEIVEHLLNRGADINAKSIFNETALIFATLNRKHNVIAFLLRKGAKVDIMMKSSTENELMTALMCAIKNTDIEAVRLFLVHNATVDKANTTTTKYMKDALLFALANADFNYNIENKPFTHEAKEVIHLLIENSTPDINSSTPNQKTPLIFAVLLGQDDIVEALIQKGVHINALDDKGWSALMHASTLRCANALTILKLLIKNKADVNACPSYENAAVPEDNQQFLDNLQNISTSSLKEMVKALLSIEGDDQRKLASILAHYKDHSEFNQSKKGKTALICASENGSLEIVNTLLKNGANPDVLDERDKTALMYAKAKGHTKIIHTICEHIFTNFIKKINDKSSASYKSSLSILSTENSSQHPIRAQKSQTIEVALAFKKAILTGDFSSLNNYKTVLSKGELGQLFNTLKQQLSFDFSIEPNINSDEKNENSPK